jgi:hypothetical protein
MKKIATIFLTIILSISFAFGQSQKATTENGKRVILKSDGTWLYADTVKTVQANLDPNDCTNWIKTTEDKVSGETYTSMKDHLVVSQDGGKKGFGISLMLSGNNSIIFSIKTVGAGSCIDKGAKINILFTDGTRMELASDGDFNCKGNSTVYFGGIFGKKSQLNELKEKKIDTMRVWTSDSYVEQKFEIDQAEQLKNSLNCLLKL